MVLQEASPIRERSPRSNQSGAQEPIVHICNSSHERSRGHAQPQERRHDRQNTNDLRGPHQVSDYTNDPHIEEGDLAITVGNDRRGTVGINAKDGDLAFIVRSWQYPAEADVEISITRDEALALGHWLIRKAGGPTP